MTYEFYNEWHLGDCLWQCLYLHKVAPMMPQDSFVLYCQYHDQLQEVIQHLPNVKLGNLSERPPTAINCWIGTDRYYHNSPIRTDILWFLLDWFKKLSFEANLPTPFHTKDDFWFDYPALRAPHSLGRFFDFLIVNSVPYSGQFNLIESDMNAVIGALAQRGYSVITTARTGIPGVECTLDHGLTVSGVGRLSNDCKHHIVIMTGPAWPTFNLVNRDVVKLRILLLDSVFVDYVPREYHCRTIEHAVEILRRHKLL